MGRKAKFWKSAVCLLSAAMLTYSASAEEEKGFIVKMWEKYKSGGKEQEKAPEDKNAAVKPVPVTPRSAAKPVPAAEPAAVPAKEPVKPSPAEPSQKKEGDLFPVVSPVNTTAPGSPRKKPFSFVGEDIPKPPVGSESTSVASPAGRGASAAALPEKNEVRVVETNYADEDMEWVPEEVPQEGEGTTAGEKKPERPKLSKDQMADTIKRRLKIYSQILFMIPELQMKKSESGEEEYYYMSDGGIALKLKDLDEKTLRELFNRVNNEATRMSTERLHLQLLQQQQLMRTLQQVPQPPQQPPQPPQVFTPPPQPPQPPRVFNPPPPPPEPPRRQ